MFMFRSYQSFARDIRAWLNHLPPISAVAGVPRSGVIAAAIIAQERHVPLVPVEQLEQSARPSISRPLARHTGPTLVIDDTCWRGRAMVAVRDQLHAPGVIFGAVYAHARTHELLDVWGYKLTARAHTFDWNLFSDAIASTLATDLDGVLADESIPGIRGGPKCAPLAPAHQEIHAIITGRPERHRRVTEKWLQQHEIDYRHLYMLPDDAPPGFASVVKFKGSVFRRLHDKQRVVAYVESCPRQARWIADATKLPVVNYSDRIAYNETTPKPSWE